MKKPNITKGTHLLPYGELSPLEFERLCLWLIERKATCARNILVQQEANRGVM